METRNSEEFTGGGKSLTIDGKKGHATSKLSGI